MRLDDLERVLSQLLQDMNIGADLSVSSRLSSINAQLAPLHMRLVTLVQRQQQYVAIVNDIGIDGGSTGNGAEAGGDGGANTGHLQLMAGRATRYDPPQIKYLARIV